MERSRWVSRALTATVLAAAVAGNGLVVVNGMADALVEQSTAEPPAPSWSVDVAPAIASAAAGLMAVSVAAAGYAWGKSRAKKRAVPATTSPEADRNDDERIVAPPGFGGPVAKTRRAGAAPLVGWTLLGLALLATGASLVVAGLLTLEQTMAMEGRGTDQARLWSLLLRAAGLPLLTIGAAAVAVAWGRWFPLGAAEAVEGAGRPESKAIHLKWQRQD